MPTVNDIGDHQRVDIELDQIGHEGGDEGADEGGEERAVLEPIFAEQEILNLLEIRQLPKTDFWKVAEEEWEKCAKQFDDRVEGKKKQVLNVTNEIYQLVGFSSAFQGLLLTAVSQASLLSCKTKWWVLTLSVFASVVTAAGVWQKNIVISDLQKTIDSEDPTRKKYVRRLVRLKDLGPRLIDLHRITQGEEKKPPPKSSYLKRSERHICSYRSMIFFCLCAFGVLCAVSMNKILCDVSCPAPPFGQPAP